VPDTDFPEEKVNPNCASVESLIRLPGVGFSRAEAIIAYRDNFVKVYGKQAFENGEDLMKVKGIGPKTVENIKKWLDFD
jgi:competence protein ComEA